MGILHCFYLVSGLKLNLAKSNQFGVGVPVEEVECMASIVGCRVANFPFMYLGLPVGDNMARIKGWDSLVERFRVKLSKWKVKALSIGGRSTLIKSVLGGLGIYYLSLFVMPVTIVKKLESLRATFFWGGTETEKKMAWIKWDQVLAKKENGGWILGVSLALI